MSRITLPNNVASMPALSIRQPWAWLIVNGHKDIENRDWKTPFRGNFLVHAGKKITVADYDAAMLFIESAGLLDPALVPDIAALELGGVVGMARMVNCVTESPSGWFTGGEEHNAPGTVSYGFVLQAARPLPFFPWKGRLGFFDVRVRP